MFVYVLGPYNMTKLSEQVISGRATITKFGAYIITDSMCYDSKNVTRNMKHHKPNKYY